MATKVKARKCHICGVRPATTDQGFCHNCQSSIDAERRRKREARKSDKYVTYRGVTVALRSNGDGKYKASFSTLNPERIAKNRLINLDVYCPGYDRGQIKKLKKLCLSFAK